MYKLVALFALLACAVAIPAPAPAPGYLHAAPVVAAPLAAAPIAVAHSLPVATSYANTYKVSLKSPLIAASPYIHAAPLAATTYVKSPLIAAPATVLTGHAPLVHGYY